MQGQESGVRMSGCLYCANRKLTSEHLWGKWLIRLSGAKAGPMSRGEHTISPEGLIGRFPDGTIRPIGQPPEVRPGIGARPGTPLTLHKKIVCEACNRGWMSRLETKAQSIFEVLVAQDAVTASAPQIYDLAAWCCLKAVNHTYAVTKNQPGWPYRGTFDKASLAPLRAHQVPSGFTVAICSLAGTFYWGGHKLVYSSLGTSDRLFFTFAGCVGPLGLIVSNDAYGRGLLRECERRQPRFFQVIADDAPVDFEHRGLRNVPVKVLDDLLHEISGRPADYSPGFDHG